MIDTTKRYKHRLTGQLIDPTLIQNISVVESYLKKGFTSEDYDISAYADVVVASLGAKELKEAVSLCQEVE